MTMAARTNRRAPSQSGNTPSIEVPFTLVVDTREQHPYTFNNLYDNKDWKGRSALLIVPTVRGTLKVGDYSIREYEELIAIERKSREDLWQSVFHARENFMGRLERMQSFAWSAIMIEASWDGMLVNPDFAGGNPKSLSRTIQSWMIKYRLTHWVMAPNRDFAEALTFRLLQKFWMERQEEGK
jgi:ERCC4-type nuclease